MREVKIKGIYKHFKGDHYLVIDVANHSETKEKYAVYRRLYGMEAYGLDQWICFFMRLIAKNNLM